jgi:hypothetical protein
MPHWGTLLWTLLHAVAEKLGTQKPEILATDEAREIVFILRGVELIMPCEKCRRHYHDYRLKNPFEEFARRRGQGLRKAVREWLYALHETVNQRNGTESHVVLDNLESMYKPVKIQEAWAALHKVLVESVASGLVLSENVKSFGRHLALLVTAIA